MWGFLPQRLWATFLRRVGMELTEEVDLAIRWWAAFKAVMNGWWNDRNGDDAGAGFHVHLFRTAAEGRPWVD